MIVQAAYNAYIQCVKAFPFAAANVEELASQNSLEEIFASSSALKELSSVLDRLTHMGACELLLPSESVSLRQLGLQPGITGALIEYQVHSLEKFRHKANVVNLMSSLLASAAEVYSEADMPIRHSRVLVKALELGYFTGPDVISCFGDPSDISARVISLTKKATVRASTNV
jgi:separase